MPHTRVLGRGGCDIRNVSGKGGSLEVMNVFGVISWEMNDIWNAEVHWTLCTHLGPGRENVWLQKAKVILKVITKVTYRYLEQSFGLL